MILLCMLRILQFLLDKLGNMQCNVSEKADNINT